MSLGFASQLDKFASRLDNYAKEKLEAVGAVPQEDKDRKERASFLQQSSKDEEEDAAVAAAREQLVRLATQPVGVPPVLRQEKKQVERAASMKKEQVVMTQQVEAELVLENEETMLLEATKEKLDEAQRQVIEKSQRIDALQTELGAMAQKYQNLLKERDSGSKSSYTKFLDIEIATLRRRAEKAEAALVEAGTQDSKDLSEDLELAQNAEKEARAAELELHARLQEREAEMHTVTENFRRDRDQARLELRDTKSQLLRLQSAFSALQKQSQKKENKSVSPETNQYEPNDLISSLVSKQHLLDRVSRERETLAAQLSETKRELRDLKAGIGSTLHQNHRNHAPTTTRKLSSAPQGPTSPLYHLDRTFLRYLRDAPPLARRLLLAYVIALQLYLFLVLLFSPHQSNCDSGSAAVSSFASIRRRRRR